MGKEELHKDTLCHKFVAVNTNPDGYVKGTSHGFKLVSFFCGEGNEKRKISVEFF
jgi:hypothetical protein